MRSLLLLVSLCALSLCSGNVNAQKTPLHFGYITTITGSFVANGGIPIVDLALKLINERTDILQNYTLNYTDVLDSRCNRTVSLDRFFELINRNITYVSLLGCGCSQATIPVAEVSHYWNIPQLAYAAAASVLTDRSRFRNFFRTLVSFRYIGSSLGQLMREFGWRQMAIITQNERLFTGVDQDVESIYNTEDWILDKYIIMTGQNPLPFFDRSEARTFRIIHINTYPDIAYQLLCEAYYRKMIGPEYLWIIPMWYNEDWWMSNSPSSSNNASCTNEIMIKVLTGTIGIVPDGYLTLQNESVITFSGLTPQAFLDNYTALLQEPRYENLTALGLPGVAFDGMWTIAIGLDIASKKISGGNDSGCEDQPGDLVPLEQFNYTNMKLGCIMRQSFSEVNFLGLTGQIEFNDKGSRSDNIILYQQYRTSEDATLSRVTFGTVTVEPQRDVFAFIPGESNSTVWNGGRPPYDGYPETGIDQNSIILVIIYDIAAACGLVFAIVCFIFNVIFRKKKIVKLTSPKLNHIIILGSVLLYSCVFFYSYSSNNEMTQTILCNIRVWLFALGYCLCFGVILSKTWRVYYIFNNPKPNKKGIKDWVLILIVLVIVAIDLAIILIGSIIPQSRLISSEEEDGEHSEIINDEGMIQKNFVLVCNEQTGTIIWLALSFGYKGILQVLAVFMAFHTRRVKVRILNEAKEIAAIIYINSIILVLLTVTGFTLTSHHNTYAAVFGLGLLVEATLFLGLIFIPKMIRLYLDPQGEKIFTRTANTPNNSHAIVNSSIDPKESPDETIASLRQRVKELEGQLEMKDTNLS